MSSVIGSVCSSVFRFSSFAAAFDMLYAVHYATAHESFRILCLHSIFSSSFNSHSVNENDTSQRLNSMQVLLLLILLLQVAGIKKQYNSKTNA